MISIRSVRRDGNRVTAIVDRKPVWFESSLPLRPSIEAFATAFWPIALKQGRELRVPGSVDAAWERNLSEVASLYAEWWGDPAAGSRLSIAPLGRLRGALRGPLSPAPGQVNDRVALCFTGGVDSFFSVLKGGRTDALAFVHGFDIPLRDTARWAEAEAGLHDVAKALGVGAISIRTNLREHPTFNARGWVETHGAALAAIGHMLADQYSVLAISSTHAVDDGRAWGSDWRLDPLWSSSRLTVECRGADTPREDKIRAIAGDPLVRRHLRVCWENRDRRLNCGCCDKCVTTAVILHGCGALEGMATFDGPDLLAGRIDALPKTVYLKMYARVRERGIDGPVGAAVERLLARSV